MKKKTLISQHHKIIIFRLICFDIKYFFVRKSIKLKTFSKKKLTIFLCLFEILKMIRKTFFGVWFV